jgi:6-pyruvoyl-tetrahydropterin synthase
VLRQLIRFRCGDVKKGNCVYAVEVSDHVMVAHSFRGEVFGPAQRLHGATFAVSAAFLAEALDRNGIVVDIGCAIEVLHKVLAPLNYRNLDDMEAFKSINTTTEFLTKHVFDGLAAAVKNGDLGRDGRDISAIRVTVAESPMARAWYEGALWQQ